MGYIQGIQSNVPALTTCRHGLHNFMWIVVPLQHVHVPVRAGTGTSEQTRAEVCAHTRAHSYSVI